MANETAATCLELQQISFFRGGSRILANIDLALREKEIVGLIGPNGAGKTTLFHVIMGQVKPGAGEVLFHGQAITSWPAPRRCHAGIARTFQLPQPFPEMTALENVLMGFWFGKKEQAGSLGADRDQARELLSLAGLVHKETIRARELTLSEQRRLEVARALATRPHLLLLDEVAAGLSPKAVKQAVYLVERLQERGLTLLIIDHFLNLSLKVSHRLVALDQGEIIASGPPKEVIRHPEVMAAYLGTREGTNP